MFSCLDASIVSTALVSISVELQNYHDTPWVVLAYLLTYMSFAVGFSKLSDVYGRKNILAAAWLLFTLGSVWCGIARRMGELIAGRAVQGMGGSGLYSLAQVCLLEQGPSRPEVVGALVGITLSVSFILGPLLGGALAEWNWRGIFWFNIPFGALAVLGIYALWPEERRNRYDTTTALAKIDFLGNLLLAAASIFLVFGMQEAGSLVWSWSSPVIVGALATAGACWILLVVWEYYLFRRPSSSQRIEPIFPVHLARDRVYLSCLLTTLLTGLPYLTLTTKLPEYLRLLHHDTALAAGTHLAPMLGACALGSFLGGALSKHTNRTAPTAVVGGVLQVVGVGFLAGFSRSLTSSSGDDGMGEMGMGLGPLLGFTAIYGLGVGLGFAACTMIAAMQACGPGGGLAAAQGAVAQARVFGGALGLAACTVLLDGRLREGEVRAGLEGVELEKVQRSLMAVLELPEGVRREVVRVYLDAFGDQMLLMVVVAVVGLVVSFGMYKSKPGQVVEVMEHHKELAGRQGERGDVELSSVSSVRSLVR
ncbi:major facilitator superfamily domain-containing protein [Chaetomium tenue]|uniref:Major facilitator superfamily domain-containing protein n=1 Tax=Chaetomium tenue TaxID=1854479 RepID=A0ACB7P3I4_9PEZI|nr:major facilitator superfamily domain-containing protein [Chaetomium globosum]